MRLDGERKSPSNHRLHREPDGPSTARDAGSQALRAAGRQLLATAGNQVLKAAVDRAVSKVDRDGRPPGRVRGPGAAAVACRVAGTPPKGAAGVRW